MQTNLCHFLRQYRETQSDSNQRAPGYKVFFYRACLGASGSNEDSWSAVSLLNELHTFRQHERDTLTILSEQYVRTFSSNHTNFRHTWTDTWLWAWQYERWVIILFPPRLHEKNLSLLCLHIRLATLKAKREKMSYGAFLAARQSWETWWVTVDHWKWTRIHRCHTVRSFHLFVQASC